MNERNLRRPSAVLQVEADPRMDAALAEVAVQRRAVVVALIQLAQVADVVGDPLGRDRGVLPSRPVILAVGRERGGAEAALADLPQLLALASLLCRGRDLDPVGLVALLVDQP